MNAGNAAEQQAVALMAQNRFGEAERILAARIAAGVGPAQTWRLLARAVRAQGRIAEARDIQAKLVEALPGDLTGRFDLSESLLLLGDFQRGWREYQWRYSMPHTTRIERKVQRPRWNGAPMPGKTLLIHDEQGFGDTLQFMRLARQAKARSGANLVLEVTPPLFSLAKRMGGFDTILERGTLPPAFDSFCELMSLPMVMGLTLDDLPGPMPYLTADPARVKTWRRKLADLPRPWVALVWAGSPTHTNDANRSMRLNDFAPLADGFEGTFLAVQKGPSAAEADSPPEGMRIKALDETIRDFEDTAAILTVADLLISVDSSPVHLAGALGRPAWVLLPLVPDWRWLLGRDDSPWYPSLRLFRQPSLGDWAGVMSRLRGELAALHG